MKDRLFLTQVYERMLSNGFQRDDYTMMKLAGVIASTPKERNSAPIEGAVQPAAELAEDLLKNGLM